MSGLTFLDGPGRSYTLRRCGLDGKSFRVMRHRFNVKGGLTAWEAYSKSIASNVTNRNPLLQRLKARS